jgi:hypothetical protein
MAAKKRSRSTEYAKNLILIFLAVGVVVVFFNLDIMRKGESMFSRKGEAQLHFRGSLKRTDYEQAELNNLMRYVKSHTKIMTSATLETRLQDSYRKVTDSSQITFEVHLVMKDGTTISTSARRSTRGKLISAVLTKLNKDIKAYKKLKKDGKKMKSLINTS